MNENKPLFRKWLLGQDKHRQELEFLYSGEFIPESVKHFSDFVYYARANGRDATKELTMSFLHFIKECPLSAKCNVYSHAAVKVGLMIPIGEAGHYIVCESCGNYCGHVGAVNIEWEYVNNDELSVAFTDAGIMFNTACRQFEQSCSLTRLVFPLKERSSLESLLVRFGDKCSDEIITKKMKSVITIASSLRNTIIAKRADEKSPRYMTSKHRFIIMERDKFRCCLCGRNAKEDGVKLEVDHKFPHSLGGTNADHNLWTLCKQCNRGKAAQIVDFTE